MKFIREKAVMCSGSYKDINIYVLSTEQHTRHRKTKCRKLTTPKQARQNLKYAQQYAVQLVNTNFGNGDYIIDLTYETEPENRERAEKDVFNYVNRLKTLYKKHGLTFRAFWVTGGGHQRKKGEGLTRFHHHLIISGGADRNEIENKWNYGRIKCSRAKILQNDFGLEPRVRYMVKPSHSSEETNAKHWHSANMKKPLESRNDEKYNILEFDKLIKAIRNNCGLQYLKKLYKNYEAVEITAIINPVTNLPHIHIKLKREIKNRHSEAADKNKMIIRTSIILPQNIRKVNNACT